VPLNFTHWHGVVSVGVGLLHGFGSKYLDHACGKANCKEFAISRVSDIVCEKFSIELDFMNDLFSLNVDYSEHVVVSVGNDVFL
jgi:hypothetical protein